MKLKVPIFFKLLIVFLVVSVVPLVFSNFIIISTYEAVISESLPETTCHLEEKITLTYENIKMHASLIVLLVFVLVFFGSIIFNRSIIRPIKDLVEGSERVAMGDLNIKMEVRSQDEIGRLTKAFNEMIKKIKEKQVVLKKERSLLETKVRERTKELEEEKKSLDDRVAEKTKELKKRIEDLEKFHNITVNRELKMIELKKKIKELEKNK